MAILNSLMMPAFMVVVLLEFGLLYGAPLAFARLAFLRAGLDRRLWMPASQLPASPLPAFQAGGTLPTPDLDNGVDYVVRWSAENSCAWVRPTFKWFGFNRSLAIGRVSVCVEREDSPNSYREAAIEPSVTIEMSVRWLPVPASIFLSMPVFAMFLAFESPGMAATMFLVFVFAFGLQLWMSYRRLKPSLSIVADEIEMALTPSALPLTPPREPL